MIVPEHGIQVGDRIHVCHNGEADREKVILVQAIRESEQSEVLAVFPNRSLMVSGGGTGQRHATSWTR